MESIPVIFLTSRIEEAKVNIIVEESFCQFQPYVQNEQIKKVVYHEISDEDVVRRNKGDRYRNEDFDNRLLGYCVKEFKRRHAAEKDPCSNGKALRRLRAECVRAKRSLSSTAETVIDIDSLHDGRDFHVQISRAKFEELNADLFIRCMQIVRMCLEDAKMNNAQIDEIVLMGGSSRIPKLEEMLGRVFVGKKMCKAVNPDEAVAYGAAIQAAVMNKAKVELEVVEVTPLSLGIEEGMGVMCVVVPRNTPTPTRMEQSFITPYDNQRSIIFSIYEGERALVTDNNLLGRIHLDGLAPMRAGVAKFKVCFEVGADGIVTVSAFDVKTWNQTGLTRNVLEALKKLGYGKPMPIQAQSLPIIMSGRDCIGIAKTGSGKPLAFVLPMLRHIKDQPPLASGDGPIGLIMAPTRAAVTLVDRKYGRLIFSEKAKK